MKRLFKFVWRYKLFSAALIAIIVGLILEVLKLKLAQHWLLGTIAIVALIPLLNDMWGDLKTGRYGIDILAATAIIASVLLHQYWAAIVIVVMLSGGQALEDFAEHRARIELDNLLKHAPQKALVIKKGKTTEVKASELRTGDKILVKAGQVVPVDAIIIEGSASFDESSLTGESNPETKQVGDLILSGSINLDGPVMARAEASAEDSQYQQIIRLVRGAAANQAPFVRLADRYSLPFTLLAYGIALGMWVISGQSIRFLEVIVVATPCPLLLAAPIALISGMSRASRYGIIVKTGSALERLAEARSIAFDKTGTLTYGKLSVDQVVSLTDISQDEILTLAASLEHNSHHVLAHAITAAASTKNIKLLKTKNISEHHGLGLSAHFRGEDIQVGRLQYLIDSGVSLPKGFNPDKVNQTVVYVAKNEELAGYITLKDEIRSETLATLASLKDLGIRQTIMITGDSSYAADKIANELGINEVHAGMLPADKIHTIEKYGQRPLIFVGDGVNDAPALTAADVGIALGARGSTAASESADMVIMPDDLSHVAIARSIATQTFTIARQSILGGIGLSIGLMAVFATGKFSPLEGAILQEVVDVFVIFNALRAHLISADI